MADLLPTEDTRTHTGFALLLDRLCKAFAIGGGLALIGMAFMSLYSIVGRSLFDKPLLGDYELVQVLCAVSVSLALPYTQWIGANVIVDFFTMRSSRRTNAVLDGAAMTLLAVFSALVAWRSMVGLLDLKGSGDASMLLEIPTWWAYVPIVASFTLLTVVSVHGLVQQLAVASKSEESQAKEGAR